MTKRNNAKNKTCLSSTELISYVDGLIQLSARDEADRHLEQCTKCRQNLEYLIKIDKALAMKKTENDPFIPDFQRCLSEEQIYRYLDNNLDEADIEEIEKHILSCASCAKEIAALKNNLFSPMTAFEKEAISKINNDSIAEQVSKIISMVDADRARKPSKKPGVLVFLRRWWEKIKSIFEISIFVEKQWRWAGAVACILLVISLVGYPQYRNWRSYMIANKAINSLAQVHFITDRNTPRPIGGFNFYILGATRSHPESEKNQIVKNLLFRAIKLNPENLLAHEYLGTYYLRIEKDVDQANQHYRIAYKIDPTNADILNDLGVLALEKKNYQTAIDYFLEAQKHQPELPEAQYNLIIAYSGIGKMTEAIDAREKYKTLDPAISWYEVSESLIDTSNTK